jgi:hypothetical protein
LADINPLKAVFDDLINAQPSETDYAMIGRITLQHTGLEYQLERLVWAYMGDVDKGHIATCRMGIQELTDTLLTLVEWTEPEDHLADAFEWAVNAFHKLRVKRNSIVHGFNFEADQKSGKLFISRRTRSIVFDDFEEFELTPAALAQVSHEQVALSSFLYRLAKALMTRGEAFIGHDVAPPNEPTPLPNRPREPETLTPLPHQAPESKRRQRKASQELEARAKKLERKAEQRENAKKR